MAKSGSYQYHYGRVSTITHPVNKTKSLRVGPVPKNDNYRGAKPAALEHVVKMLKRLDGEYVVVTMLGRLYPGQNRFSWVGEVFDRESLIETIEYAISKGESAENLSESLFNLVNGTPSLVLAWEAKNAQ